MSWLWAAGVSPSCPSISPVWNLSYTNKYLEFKNVILERLISTVKESDLLPVSHMHIPLSVFYGKNPPHLDNRYKENRFVWSNHTVKCSGLAPLCSLFLHWPGVGKFQISALRSALFAKTHLALMACVKAVTRRAKPGSYFSKIMAIHSWCPGICYRAAALGIWYGTAGAFWAGSGQGCLCSPAPSAHALMKGVTELPRKQL